MQLMLALPLGILAGLIFCGIGGGMLQFASFVYNIRRPPQTGLASPFPEAEDKTEADEYTTVDAGPYTSPVTFTRRTTKIVDDASTSEENTVPMPSLLCGAQITFLTWLIGAFSIAFLFMLISRWARLPQFFPYVSLTTSLLVPAIPVMVQTLIVAEWLKISLRKALVLSVFCGIQWVLFYFAAIFLVKWSNHLIFLSR